MSAATELAPARPRAPSRAVRKRDERVRRVVRWLKKDATFLDKPRYAPLLRIYAGLTIKYETLLSNINAKYGDDLLDELGHAVPALETLQRLAKTCASIGAQLGLAPGAERAMRHSLDVQGSHRKWIDLASARDEEVVPSPASAASGPPAATNGTSIPGFTAPA
jgi:hypothetical protein